MAEKQQPWGKWFWGDWRKDARLRRCCYAARGLWADMLSLMGGECDRFGYLIMEGQALGVSDLVGLLGGSLREVAKMLSDLESRRVFSRTGDADLEPDLQQIIPADMPAGVIFSRRMVRDKAKADADRANGGRGGNPALKGEDNRGVNPKDKAQIPESRTKSKKENTAALARFDEFWSAYPKRVKRGAAERAWIKALKLADAETIIAAAHAYAPTRAGQDKTFTPHPASWLNDKGWLDEGLVPVGPQPTADEIAAAADKADKLRRRGKYDPQRQMQ